MIAALALLILSAACGVEPMDPFTAPVIPIYGGHRIVALAESTAVSESSGVAASRTHPHVYWTHNDSGGANRVVAFRLSDDDRTRRVAKDLGYVELTGASNVDWEDIAAGPDRTLYVLDGGDNPPCGRADKRLLRFAEPALDPEGPPISFQATPEVLRFEYPDRVVMNRRTERNEDRFDAECLIVDPHGGDVYVVTKRDNDNRLAARVFRLAASAMVWNGDRVHVLEGVGDLTSDERGMVTAGDVTADGRRVVIRDYATAYEFVLPRGEPFEAVFRQPAQEISLLGELQGEGISYTADGRDLVTTAEVKRIGPKTMPVFVTPRVGERPMTSATRAADDGS